MKHVCRGLPVAFAALGLVALLNGDRLDAQGKGEAKGEAKSEPVKITTIDGVDIHGQFYPSAKRDAPCIIMLHKLSETGMTKSFTTFAEAMQPNFSVMLFDFRGHGKSKDIDPQLFRKYAFNLKVVKGDAKKATIEFASFPQDYYPALCNDIAAVKAFLDRKNDTGACNTSSTILVGAETGAALGAVWLNSQWSLHRLIPNAVAGFPPQIAPNSEGKDVIACIWLSAATKLGSYSVSYAKTLATPVRANATATVFIYGGDDTSGKTVATAAADKLRADPKDTKYQFVKEYGVKGTTLKGIKLLSPGLSTQQDITDYLERVVEKKAQESTKRDFRNTDFIWQGRGVPPPLAKSRAVDMNNLHFDDYLIFFQR